MKPLTFLILATPLVFWGCNLSEAERMDMSRGRVHGISSQLDAVKYMGGNTIPLTALLRLDTRYSGSPLFQLAWIDKGTNFSPSTWGLEARRGNDVIFVYVISADESFGWFQQLPSPGDWLDNLDSIHFTLVNWHDAEASPQALGNLSIVDDRPVLASRLRNDTATIKQGDTIAIEVDNQSNTDSIEVGSDYVGLRMVGDYVLNLKPGRSEELRWIVLAAPGQSIWIDLAWGLYGQSRRFAFTIH